MYKANRWVDQYIAKYFCPLDCSYRICIILLYRINFSIFYDLLRKCINVSTMSSPILRLQVFDISSSFRFPFCSGMERCLNIPAETQTMTSLTKYGEYGTICN